MSIQPILTFRAGHCDFDSNSSPPNVRPKPTPGFLYLYEDELLHLAWRPRSSPVSEPEVDLVMLPTDGRFIPYKPDSKSPTDGRFFVLKFQSSSKREIFWLQAKSQHENSDPSWFSPRDFKLGEIVDKLLQGEEVNVGEELAKVRKGDGGNENGDAMEDVRPEGPGDIRRNIGSGDPFMGNPEDEGEGPREGGADGGRAAAMPTSDAAEAVHNFLRSMQGNQALSSQQTQQPPILFTTLPDLLPTSITISVIDAADSTFVNKLLSNLPPILLLLGQEADDASSAELDSETAKAAMEALSLGQKKEMLRKVLRSPQFMQSLGSLTGALRDGGLPTISEALGIPTRNGGYVRGSGVPLGGGDAVEAFLDGVKVLIKEGGNMDTE